MINGTSASTLHQYTLFGAGRLMGLGGMPSAMGRDGGNGVAAGTGMLVNGAGRVGLRTGHGGPASFARQLARRVQLQAGRGARNAAGCRLSVGAELAPRTQRLARRVDARMGASRQRRARTAVQRCFSR